MNLSMLCLEQVNAILYGLGHEHCLSLFKSIQLRLNLPLMKSYIAALALSIGSISVSYAEVIPTPIRVYPTSPFQANSLAIQLRSAFPVEQSEIFAVGTVSSVWAHSDEFQLDYYQNQSLAGIQWRVSERLSAEVQYQYSWAANNHLDSLTISFHDLFGIGQNGREDVPKHQFTLESSEYGFSVTDFEGETMVNALHGYLQYQLVANGPHALSIGGSLYYNDVNDSQFKETSFEQGAQINYSMINGDHSLFSTVGLTHRIEDDFLNTPMPTKNFTAAWALGYAYRFGRVHEAVIQYHGFEGVLKDDSEFSQPSHEVVLGYRYHLPSALIELSATENMVNMDNSTDIAFSLGLRYFL